MMILISILVFLAVIALVGAVVYLAQMYLKSLELMVGQLKEVVLEDKKNERAEMKRYEEHEASNPDELKELSEEEVYAFSMLQAAGINPNGTSGDDVDGD